MLGLGGLLGQHPKGPVRIPVVAAPAIPFGVYYTPLYPPLGPDELRARLAGWLDQHVDEPLRSALKPAVASTELLTYLDMHKTALPPPTDPAQAGATPEEGAKLEQAWQVMAITGHPAVQVPVFGLWGALAGARSAAQDLDGVAIDTTTHRVLRAEPESVIAGSGKVVLAEHVTIAPLGNPSGAATWRTAGLQKFGLPNLQLRGVLPGSGDPGLLLVETGQQLLDALLRANHGREQPLAELEIGSELTVSGATAAHLEYVAGADPLLDVSLVTAG